MMAGTRREGVLLCWAVLCSGRMDSGEGLVLCAGQARQTRMHEQGRQSWVRFLVRAFVGRSLGSYPALGWTGWLKGARERGPHVGVTPTVDT